MISRQFDQAMIDWVDGSLSTARRKHLMARRKSKAEGSFADATNNHGYKRMRWRGLLNAGVQNLLIATIQNIRKLIKPAPRRLRPNRVKCAPLMHAVKRTLAPSIADLIAALQPKQPTATIPKPT